MRDVGMMSGGRSRDRTYDPLIKSHQKPLICQVHFDIFTVRSGIEPEGKLENIETKTDAIAATLKLSPRKALFSWRLARLIRATRHRLVDAAN
jgi:hypothetical protein